VYHYRIVTITGRETRPPRTRSNPTRESKSSAGYRDASHHRLTHQQPRPRQHTPHHTRQTFHRRQGRRNQKDGAKKRQHVEVRASGSRRWAARHAPGHLPGSRPEVSPASSCVASSIAPGAHASQCPPPQGGNMWKKCPCRRGFAHRVQWMSNERPRFIRNGVAQEPHASPLGPRRGASETRQLVSETRVRRRSPRLTCGDAIRVGAPG
jgi:hypothetical protein